jgi:hypothetical protein
VGKNFSTVLPAKSRVLTEKSEPTWILPLFLSLTIILGLDMISPNPSSSKNLNVAVAFPKKLPTVKSEATPKLKSGCKPLEPPPPPLPSSWFGLSDSVLNNPTKSVLDPESKNCQSMPIFLAF